MKKIAGIRFRERGFIRHFDCGNYEIKRGDYVLGEGDEGVLAVGIVVEGPIEFPDDAVGSTIRKIERPATEEEIKMHLENLEIEEKAKQYCLERIEAHGLPMKLVDVELLFDRSKIIFFYTAEGRVDFRELLKDLVRHLRMRIELRQIGVRNRASMVGGIGMCGRPVCCAQFLTKFHPVSIKMAKEQNLSLNPFKISGVCGRLMCCLQYETDIYLLLKQDLPKVGKRIKTEYGEGKVIRQNAIERTVTVELDDGCLVEITFPPLEYNETVESKYIETGKEEGE